jgi:hypothetical protein
LELLKNKRFLPTTKTPRREVHEEKKEYRKSNYAGTFPRLPFSSQEKVGKSLDLVG